jgi:REP-associated tyrosine transposase
MLLWQSARINMPRPPRVFVPGLSLHVYQRAHNCSRIVEESADHECLLDLVRTATRANGVDVHGFAIMNTHYHLLATPQHKNALPRAMQLIDGGYVRYYNEKHGRMGTSWCGRYKARLIADERYWLTCLRYIDLNPVEAKMVTFPEEYQWCSYRAHALETMAGWLVSHPVYDALGVDASARQLAYRDLCEAGIPKDVLLP